MNKCPYRLTFATTSYDREFEDKESFQFRRDRPLKRLQKILLWLLRKLGCQRLYRLPGYKETTIEMDKLIPFIQQCWHQVMKRCDCPDRPIVLIGYETFEDFVYGEECRDLQLNFDFEIPLDDLRPSKWDRARLRGFRIVVLPWFKEGVTFLPPELFKY